MSSDKRSMTYYLAAIHQEEGLPGYAVLFPGVPGCQTQGGTLDEAIAMAEDALSGFFEGEAERPLPLSAEEAARHEDGIGATYFVAIPASPAKGKSVRISITMDENILKIVDEKAKAAGMTRSGYLASSVMARLR